MSDDLLKFDFGFTAVDEDEIDAVQEVVASSSSAAAELKTAEDKLDNLYKHFMKNF